MRAVANRNGLHERMRHSFPVRVTGALVATVAAVCAIGAPPAAAQICLPQMPPRVDLVQGYAFEGILTEAATTDVSQSYDFNVERVIQNGNDLPDHGPYAPLSAGSTLHEQTATACAVTNLRVGERYLVSAFALTSFESYYTAVWHVTGDRVALVRMYDDHTFDRRLAQVTTVDQAITLITTGSLPDTATASDPLQPQPPFEGWQFVVSVLLAVSGLAVGYRLTRPQR